MQQVYANVTKVMIDSRQGSNLLYLPLDRILQQVSQGGAAAVAPDPGVAAPGAPGSSTSPDARNRDTNARGRERESR
jgi:membrane protease subunit HflK